MVATVVSDGHQCQPSLFMVLPMIAPDNPIGCGGIGGCVSGESGSPDRPDVPIIRSFSSKNGVSASYSIGQSSATPSNVLTLKSEGCNRGQCAVYITVEPPTAL
ncbi:hypothetical protein ACVWZ6_003791 [Bradyrhizobium sp. GM6.1]